MSRIYPSVGWYKSPLTRLSWTFPGPVMCCMSRMCIWSSSRRFIISEVWSTLIILWLIHFLSQKVKASQGCLWRMCRSQTKLLSKRCCKRLAGKIKASFWVQCKILHLGCFLVAKEAPKMPSSWPQLLSQAHLSERLGFLSFLPCFLCFLVIEIPLAFY